ncbi:MAG: hypothetical protein PHY72_02900 [Candidatus Pacebacteria bacterium]|nr:hypothetical protein [Candidatus Paceibacterota bacterium]
MNQIATKNSQPEQLELFPTDLGISKMMEIMFDEDIDILVKQFVIKAWSFWPLLLNVFIRCGLGKTEKDVLIYLGKLAKGFSEKVSWGDIKNITPNSLRQLALLVKEKEPGEVNPKTLFGVKSHQALRIITEHGFVGEKNFANLLSIWQDCCDLYQTPQIWTQNFLKAEKATSALKRELQNQVGELPFLPTKGQAYRIYLSGLTWLAWASFYIHLPQRMGELDHFFEVPCLPDDYLGRRRVDHVAVVNFNQKDCPPKPHIGHLIHFGKTTVISEWKMWLENDIPLEPSREHLNSMQDYLLRSIISLAMVKNGRFSFEGVDWREFRGLIKYVFSFKEPISYQISLPFQKGEKILMELASCFNGVKERARLRQFGNKILQTIEGQDPKKQLELDMGSPSQLFLSMYGRKKI